MADSAILDVPEVTGVGRRSFSIERGGLTLGTGVTLAVFHWLGTRPCLIGELMSAQIGAANNISKLTQESIS